MPRVIKSSCAVAFVGATMAGCQSAPATYVGEGAHATYQAASLSVTAVRSAGGEIYLGAGRALRQPFHDLNMLQDQIPPVLLRAESRPYDLTRVNSCSDVLDQVAELDLALGPDVDLPKLKRKRSARDASFAAATALDAAGSAAEHFIPMRSTIRQITGAQRYDNHFKHAVLAGTTRRSFLKAVGMSHGCAWPAAPVDFTPDTPAVVDALWVAPPGSAPAMVVASAPPSPPAGVQPAVRVAQVTTISAAMTKPTPAPSSARPLGPVMVAVNARLTVPSAAPPAQAPAQGWRPASSARMVMVSTPLTTTASASSAKAPWSQGFANASAHP